MNSKNLLGRVVALALMIGAVCGVRAISRGSYGCALGAGSCCMHEMREEGERDADAKAAPAKADADADKDEAKIQAKAPVSPPKPAE